MILVMFFQKINFINPVWNLEGIEIPTPGERLYEKHFFDIEKIVPTNLLNQFRSINIVPEYVRLFVWPINYCGIWHIDGTAETFRQSAINWILHGSGLIQFNNSVELHTCPGVHKGKQGALEDHIDAETNGHSCLINTSACHRVVTGNDGRTSISLSWKTNDIPFNVVLEKLRQINMI